MLEDLAGRVQSPAMVAAGQRHEVRIGHRGGGPSGVLEPGMILGAGHPERRDRAVCEQIIVHRGGGIGGGQQSRDGVLIGGQERRAGGAGAGGRYAWARRSAALALPASSAPSANSEPDPTEM